MKQQSISRILNTRIALVVICVNVFVFILFYFFSVQLAEQEFQQTLKQQTNHLAATFTQQLWLFDLNTTERLASMAYESQQVSGLRLVDHDGHLLVEKGNVSSAEPYYLQQRLIHDSGTDVGTLELVYTNVGQETQRTDILIFSISIVCTTILLTFVLISRVISRYLVRPLQELQQGMGLLGGGRFEVSTLSGKTSEIQAIIDDFNSMTTALAQREDERNQAEEQQRKLENELRQKYKMEAVGLMAGGIAHNFNNNLAIILGNLELAQLKAGDDVRIADHLRDANIAVHRARDLTKQILTYSRQGGLEHAQLKPALIVAETVKLLRSTVPTTVNLECLVPEDLADVTINGDSSRVQEALLNLTNNAVQAMEEVGNLTISMEKTTLTHSDIPVRSHCLPGRYVKLSVKDSGCGMSKDVIEKIFDPFFTTKDVDQGTGMGLSTVQGIVEQHKGFVQVSSELGEGAVFELFFPETAAVDEAPLLNDDDGLPRGSERILFVDDDELLAGLGEMLLTNQGYQVVAETSSKSALEIFQKHPDRFDLVITDQTMPQMTGLEMINKMRQIRSSIPTILCTGYSSKASAEELKKQNVGAFCLKPLKLSDLAQAVRSVLDRVPVK